MEASERIDQQIADLADWRGESIARIRALVGAAEPALKEEWKWNTGMWTYDKKLVCGYGAFKEHVKINFFKGVHLQDPKGLFTAGEAKESRSIDLRAGDTLDEAAVSALVHEAVAYFVAGGK